MMRTHAVIRNLLWLIHELMHTHVKYQKKKRI